MYVGKEVKAIFKNISFYVYEYLFACMCMYTTCVQSLWRPERAPDTLELKLLKIESCQVDTGN